MAEEYPFFHGYLAASEIVRASSDTAEGPYHFEEVILSDRGADYWDGRMCHNPYIIKHGDEYLLFYIGAAYEGERPSRETMDQLRSRRDGPNGKIFDWYPSIRIGVARSTSVFGPWQRPNEPTFNNNPDGWDYGVVTIRHPVSHLMVASYCIIVATLNLASLLWLMLVVNLNGLATSPSSKSMINTVLRIPAFGGRMIILKWSAKISVAVSLVNIMRRYTPGRRRH